MAEEIPERISDADRILLERIENSIKNDGFSRNVIRNYLQNPKVSIPGLRWKMSVMLHTVEEPYAACFFHILSDIEKRCHAGKISAKEIADLSQQYFQAIRNLAESGYPAESILKLLQEKQERDECPAPCELYSVFIVFQKEKIRKLEEDGQKLWLGCQNKLEIMERKMQDYGNQLEEVKTLNRKPELEGISDQWKKLFNFGNRKRKKQKVTFGDVISELKKHGCPPTVMQEVEYALAQDVPLQEIYDCILEAYKEDQTGSMAASMLHLFAVRQSQINRGGKE